MAHSELQGVDRAAQLGLCTDAGGGAGDGGRAHAGEILGGLRADHGSSNARSTLATSGADALAAKAARAARETQACLERVYERKRQDKGGDGAASGLMGGQGSDGGRRRRRQADGGVVQKPAETISRQISEWRQRFLSASAASPHP